MKTILSLFSLLLLFSCATKQSETQKADNTLYNTWQLTHLNNEKVSFTTTLIVTKANYSGHAACNNYGGSLSILKNTIVFGATRATKMACSNLNKEQQYFNMLPKIHYYKISNNILLFYDAKNKLLMTFTLSKI